MSAALVIPEVLPFVWALAADHPDAPPTPYAHPAPQPQPGPYDYRSRPPAPQMAFYRKYTEALLRRYVRMSMEAGKVPSLLGKEMFRAKVTSYRVESFEDVVIFVHDIERCLHRLEYQQQRLIARISLEEYTLQEAAAMLGLPPRTAVRHYCRALDTLTRIFLEARMLEPMKYCQEAKFTQFSATC